MNQNMDATMVPSSREGCKVSFGGRLHRYHKSSAGDAGHRWKCAKSCAAFKCPGFVTTTSKEIGAHLMNNGPRSEACERSHSGIGADAAKRGVIGMGYLGSQKPVRIVADAISGVSNEVLSRRCLPGTRPCRSPGARRSG